MEGLPTEGVLRGIRRRPGPHRHEYHAGPLAPESARSCIPEFVKAARTMRKHHDGIDAAIDPTANYRTAVRKDSQKQGSADHPSRLRSPQSEAALTTIMLACGPVNLELPYHLPHLRRTREPLSNT